MVVVSILHDGTTFCRRVCLIREIDPDQAHSIPGAARPGSPRVGPRRPGSTVPNPMQTRYLILASLITGIAILVAAALWLTRF